MVSAIGSPVVHGNAQVALASESDLAELSLDQLMNIEVTSVSKRAEPLFKSPAAIFVLTGEEIRRSGVRTIAGALRMVPGLQVTRTSAQEFTVTSRGLGGDKLEVVMDGRSVYTPLTSQVFWDVLDTYLADIDRIEVIRGPGATLWGANAVNGVINIVTRPASETQGTEFLAGGGNDERVFGALRTGAKIGDNGYARLYVKGREVGNTVDAEGQDELDGMRYQTAGFRYDSTPGSGHRVSVSGSAYDSRQDSAGLTTASRAISDASGGNLGASWSVDTANWGQFSFAGYYDRYKRFIPSLFEETRDTYDLSLEHRLNVGKRHSLTWGMDARRSEDETGGSPLAIIFSPQNREINTYSAFVQDQIQLWEGAQLIIGSKFENNDFTGDEFQPGARLGWSVNETTYAWLSAARAVRTPNRLDHDVAIFCSPGIAPLLGCVEGSNIRFGSRDFESEVLNAFEAGLRWSNSEHLSVDLALFFNDYQDLRTQESDPQPLGSVANLMDAEALGGEISVVYALNEWIELRPYYAYLDLDAQADQASTDTRGATTLEESSARHKTGLRGFIRPADRVTADFNLRYVSALDALAVPAYAELSVRLGWKVRPGIELALIGHNLLDSQHPESGSPTSATQPMAEAGNEIERSFIAEIRWTPG